MKGSGADPASIVPQGSGEVTSPSEPMFLAVGRVLRPHGLNGELRVEIHTDYPERFALHQRLYLGKAARTGQPAAGGRGKASAAEPPTGESSVGYTPYVLQSVRFHQDRVLLKLEGVDDRNGAEALREQWVWIPVEEAAPLAEGECYLHEILHLRVVTVDGEELGRVAEIIETGANLVYVVQGTQGEILLPDIDEVVVKVDVGAGQMIVQLIEGLR